MCVLTVDFDITVIGSGPTATAILLALPSQIRVCVITGEFQNNSTPKRVHPKIRSAAAQEGLIPELADGFITSRNVALYSSAAPGGLANYWGQQFVRYSQADPWRGNSIASYQEYLDICQILEKKVPLVGGRILGNTNGDDRYEVIQPRLVSNGAGRMGGDGRIMRSAFERAVGEVGASVSRGRAQWTERSGNKWTVHLDNGDSITSSKVIIAAGPIGSARFISNSFKDISGFHFDDHTPEMLYVLKAANFFGNYEFGSFGQFNELTIERSIEHRTALFASVYNLRQADFNLLLATVISTVSTKLRGLGMPPGVGIVRPIQVWTPSTLGSTFVPLGDETTPPILASRGNDMELDRFLQALSAVGAVVLMRSETKPGLGFHYHNVRFDCDEGQSLNVTDFLNKRTDGTIVCLDAAGWDKIGTRPPTLTIMAGAFASTQRLIQQSHHLRD